MKKLVMLSNESIFSGVVKCGMAEMVDSLANSLGQDYHVTIVCPDGNGTLANSSSGIRTVSPGVRACRFSYVDYYMIDKGLWPVTAAKVADMLQPDILHNLAEPNIIRLMNFRPAKSIYTFDAAEPLRGFERYLKSYDSITTTAVKYAELVMEKEDELSNTLSNLDFVGITNGILDTVLTPEKGLLLSAKYSALDHSGKRACKQHLLQAYGIQGNPYICTIMSRLVKDKGIDYVIDAIPVIKDTGGMLIVVGKGDHIYEDALRKLHKRDGVIYVDKWASPVQAAPLMAGSDFYLQPSIMEVCGLMPLTASKYGAIPIVTRNGGLADSFTDHNAIIVGDDGLESAIRRAAELYADTEAMSIQRKICMEQDFSWRTRKAGYIELYEKGASVV